MASIGTLYGQSFSPKVLRSIAAAKFNGVTLDFVNTLPPVDTQKPEYLKKFPLGEVPAFEGADGFRLTGGNAIIAYVSSLSEKSQLFGKDNKEYASVVQWLNVIESLIVDPAFDLTSMYDGSASYAKAQDEADWKKIFSGLDSLEKQLTSQTFLVGDRITGADLTAATALYFVFTRFVGEKSRAKYPHTMRYYNTMVNQRVVAETHPEGADLIKEDTKYVAPKKEKPAKEAPAPKAAAAAATEQSTSDAPAKNPLDTLPKSSFNLNDWKVTYSNKDTRSEAIPWFHEHFDKEGWSVWRFDFKYNDELTQVFMSSNQIGGFFNRLEANRKYLMGTAGVFGKANDSVITGVVLLRGQEWEPVLSCAPDIDSYDVSRLDLDKPEDKKFFEDMLAWEATVDGKEWADGKILK